MAKLSTARFFLLAILLLATSLYGLFIYRTAFPVHGHTSFTLVDDAMISMRYARNLASGDGLVWNAGEPPIEGFTNLLWVGLMAILHLFMLPPSAASLAVMVCSTLALLANIFVVWRIAREISPDTWLGPTLAILLTALYFPLVYWSLRGLELGFIFLLLNTSILCVVRLNARPAGSNLWTLISCLSLALMTRPDSMTQVSVLVLVGVVLLLRAGRRSAALSLFGGVLVVWVGLTAFRYWYFGDILPNTYYLKVTGVSAMERIQVGYRVFVEKSGPRVLFLVIVSAGAAFINDNRLRKGVGLFLALFLAQAIYSIYVGGDYAEGFVGGEDRFLAQAFSPLILAYSLIVPHFLGIRSWEKGETAKIRLEGAYLLLVIGLGSAALISGKEWDNWRVENAPMLRSDIERMKLGLVIERGTKSDAVIAVHAAGNIPYYCRRNVVDLFGKSDRRIAHGAPKGPFVPGHNKWDYDYSIGTLRPDVIADGWEPLWDYIQNHPGQYSHILPAGIFILPDSGKVNPEILRQE